MEWRSLFEKRVLARGCEYYEDGFVKDFLREADFIQATVQGSSDYDVLIDLLEGEIVDMHCDCPYAAEEKHCKHMAAVLFYAEDEPEACSSKALAKCAVPAVKAREEAEQKICQLVERADEALLRSFLTNALREDGRLLARFKQASGAAFTVADLQEYQRRICAIFDEYADRSGFIDYRQAEPFAEALTDFLEEEMAGLVKRRYYEEAFALTNDVFLQLADLEIDDSSGETTMLVSLCEDIWQEIYKQCDQKMKEKMLQWYFKQMDRGAGDFMQYIESMVFETFAEDAFLAEKRAYIEKKIRRLKAEKESWSRDRQMEQWLLYHIDVMQKQKDAPEKVEAYCKANMEYSKIRKYYVALCLEKKDYDAAIRALEEGKQFDQDKGGNVAHYSLQLKELYKALGNQEAYKAELWALLLQYRPGDLAIFKELKALYSEEAWKETREIVFQKLPKRSGIDRLYEAEHLYDRLLQIVLQAPGLGYLEMYEKCLRNLYPAELLEKYAREVKQMALHPADRKQYAALVDLLRKMRTYPDGAACVQAIVEAWRVQYKRRRAMMEELNKLQ